MSKERALIFVVYPRGVVSIQVVTYVRRKLYKIMVPNRNDLAP